MKMVRYIKLQSNEVFKYCFQESNLLLSFYQEDCMASENDTFERKDSHIKLFHFIFTDFIASCYKIR